MWRPEVREVVEQIDVRPDAITRDLSIGVIGKEYINNIVAERPAIARKTCWAPRVIGKNVRQQLFRDRDCVFLRITA
jgi:hypothetical protein